MGAVNHTKFKEKNFIEAFLYRYLPYWPLFIMLLILAGFGAYAYLKYFAKPVYEISANILVDDEKKGADESKLMAALNISSSKIVDNEIEVIRSKELLKVVIDSLLLYAPVFEEGRFVDYSAYTSSPVIMELKNPGSVPNAEPVYFTYNKTNNAVSLGGKSYRLNEWVSTPFGVAKFNNNPHLKKVASGPLYFSIVNPRQVLDALSLKLFVTPASKLSSVIILTINDEVPERGEDILNLLIKAYYSSGLDDKNLLASNTLSFVESRIEDVSKELDSIENQIQQYRNQKGAINLSEQGKLYLQTVGDNDRKMTDLNMQLAMLSEVEKYVLDKDKQIGIVPSIITNGSKDQQVLVQLVQKLFESQMQYERLKKTVPVGNPAMYSLQNEIENMRPTILENLQNQRKSLMAGKYSLRTETGKYLGMLQSIPQKEKELLDISRQQAIKNDAYSFLLQKREETALAYAAMVPNGKTISHANASFLPISPKKLFVFSSAFGLALILGLAFVNGKELLTNKILFRSDIENITSIPIVAEIMSIKGTHPILLNNRDQKQLGCMEQFHQLRFSIGLNNKLLNYKKILVTSGNTSEGKSFISNNLALSLASSGKKVVLLDFDFRRPKTSELYQLKDKKGIAELFENEELLMQDIIYPTENQDLFIIPAGYSQVNPTELLLTKDLDKLFNYLEKSFDYIIMDTAPIDPVIDAYLVSEYCDTILFVIRHGYSSKTMLESLQNGNKLDALKNIFIVFNGIKARGFLKKEYGFGYGYGSNKVYGEKIYQISNNAAKKV